MDLNLNVTSTYGFLYNTTPTRCKAISAVKQSFQWLGIYPTNLYVQKLGILLRKSNLTLEWNEFLFLKELQPIMKFPKKSSEIIDVPVFFLSIVGIEIPTKQ